MMNVADIITVLEDASTQVSRAIDASYEDNMKLARGHAVAAYNLLSVVMTLTEQEGEQ